MSKDTVAMNRAKQLRQLAGDEILRAENYERLAREARWDAEVNEKLAEYVEKSAAL